MSISIPPWTLAPERPAASAYRCAPWTRAQGVDPVGSALTTDLIVLIETPPPWPQDVSGIPVFAALARLSSSPARLLAVRPADDGPIDPDRLSGPDGPDGPDGSSKFGDHGGGTGADPAGVGVTIWRRTESGGFSGTDHVVAAGLVAAGLASAGLVGSGQDAAAQDTAAQDTAGAAGQVAAEIAQLLDTPGSDPAARPAPAEVLLCGHGSRDRCCGRFGTRLALDAVGTWPGVRVRRCSHTGGHRYAPTGFTLPDGLAWGFLDSQVLDAIVRRSGPPPLADHYRGTTALDMWAQVAERALFARFGWGWLEHRLTAVDTEVADDRRSATVRLAWDGPTGPGRASAVAEVARDVPVLVCGEPPEHAKKTSPELTLRSLSLGPPAAG